MKPLFFRAVAAHATIAPALMGQAEEVLRPFRRFLTQAIHTAKQRQTRYQLKWKRVRELRTFHLKPVDSLLRVPRRAPRMVLTDWPATKTYDLDKPGFVMNRSIPVRFQEATPSTGGLIVTTDPPLLTTDLVIWCEEKSHVARESLPSPPGEVMDEQGRRIQLRVPPSADEDGRHWLLVLEGEREDGALLVDGTKVEAEVLPASEGLRRLVDPAGRAFAVNGQTLRCEEPPADGLLVDERDLRYRLERESTGGRSGCWIQLLEPETAEADDVLDARAAFCEGDVRDVWSQPRHAKESAFAVKKIDQERYQLLLDRYPSDDSTLYLPVDLRNLYLQKRALDQLASAPLPHHQGLLRLCEDPARVRWPKVSPVRLPDDGWRALTDDSRSGTDEQRAFVQRAIGSPDFAFLEGPPGSGKTTAICEIVQQLVEQGKRVLLCASTHVAIDNVLERLLDSSSPIDAVRIGKLDKVDDKVQRTQLDRRVEMLLSSWRTLPSMHEYGESELEAMAERTVIMAANLTCGTTMGIVNHPLFRGRDENLHRGERPITTMPHWDVLIIDEASKTLIQEFLVPALMAMRWIIVGDVRQLPPFADRSDLLANLRELVDEKGRPVFPPDHQRACLLRFRLLHPRLKKEKLRWLLVERPGVLEWLARELQANPDPDLTAVRVVAGRRESSSGLVVTIAQLREGSPEALRLAAADWVLVGDDLIAEVAHLLPGNLLIAEELTSPQRPMREANVLLMRQSWWLQQAGLLKHPYRDRKLGREEISTFSGVQTSEREWLQRNDLASELAWRITRLHELRHGRSDKERSKLRADLQRLQPATVTIDEQLAEIEDIGLPSILEVLQEGIGTKRAKRSSALTAGFRTTCPEDFAARFASLSYQHRMHPDISAFSRELIYGGGALKDANTIQSRDDQLAWDFGSFRARRVWANIDGREQSGVNQDEVDAMAGLLRELIAWARRKGPPFGRAQGVWEVACLCFYVKQERAVSEMLRELTRDKRHTRFRVEDAPIEIVCSTVDRFQGREADLVMLSMRNTRRVGFLNSLNRLNVAVTRPRQQLVVFGKADYFKDCHTSELEELARRTARVEEQKVRQWRSDRR